MKRLIQHFCAGSIRQKQLVAILGGTLLMLLINTAALFTYELVTYRNSMVRNLTSIASVVGANAASALDFNDQKNAAIALETLASERGVVRAVLYDREGNLFTEFRRFGVPSGEFERPNFGRKAYLFERVSLFVRQPVAWKGEEFGEIIIESDLTEIKRRTFQYTTIALIILFSSCVGGGADGPVCGEFDCDAVAPSREHRANGPHHPGLLSARGAAKQ